MIKPIANTTLLCIIGMFLITGPGIAEDSFTAFDRSSTYHTIVVDGVNDSWTGEETFTNITGASELYFTWDADNIYIGISGSDADFNNMAQFVFIDADPYGTGGTTSAYAWGENVTTPFSSDYVIVCKNSSGGGDYIEVKQYESGSWQTNVSENSNNYNNTVHFEVAAETEGNYRELLISRSVFGNPDHIRVCTMTEQQWGGYYRYFAWPGNDWTDANRAPGQSIPHYYGFPLTDAMTPTAVEFYDYDPVIAITVAELDAQAPSTTVTVPITVDFPPGLEFSSFEFYFDDYQNELTYNSVEGTGLLTEGWVFSVNENYVPADPSNEEYLAIAAAADNNPVSSDGILFNLLMDIPADASSGTVTIDFVSGLFNNDEITTSGTDGSVLIDATPPAFAQDFPFIDNVSAAGFDIHFQVDDAATGYYVVLDADGNGITAAQVSAGTDQNDQPADFSGNTALTADTETVVTVSGLAEDTAYYIYVTAEDALNNASAVQPLTATTGINDTTPPGFIVGYPAAAGITGSGFTLEVQLDETGTVYYAILTDGSPAPTSSELKNGTAGLQNGSLTVDVINQTFSQNITGLNSETAYDVYAAAEDDVPNLQSSPTLLDVTTADVTVPQTAVFTPADNSTGVALAADLALEFNEDIQLGSAGSVTIYTGANDEVFESMDVSRGSVSADGNTLTITHTEFDESTDYYVLIDAGAVEDISGNDFGGISESETWNFTTGDFTGPQIQSLLPADDAAGQALDAAVSITMDEDIQLGSTGAVSIKYTSDNSDFQVFNSDSENLSITDAALTITHGGFAEETGYYILIDSGIIEDLSGNAFTGISAADTWNFTTGDFTGPTVDSTSPADDAQGVLNDAVLEISFSENISKGTGSISIYLSNHTLFQAIDVTTADVTVTGAAATILHDDFSDLTGYYILIDSGALTDISGNAFTGIASSDTWNFTTADQSAPVLDTVTPTDGSEEVASDVSLTLSFSENVQAGTGSIIIHEASNWGSGTIEVDISSSTEITINANEITVDPASNLETAMAYYVTIAAGVITDTAGNEFNGITDTETWEFTTIPFYGDVDLNGQVRAYDAAVILSYLAESADLNNSQLLNSNVTTNDDITAFDASAILQYVVQLIESLPVESVGRDGNPFDAAGSLVIGTAEIQPGEVTAVPIYYEDLVNVHSFDFLLEFDPQHLNIEQIDWSNEVNGIMVESGLIAPGSFRILGAGTVPKTGGGLLATVFVHANESLLEPASSLVINQLQWNEMPVVNGAAESQMINFAPTGDINYDGLLDILDIVQMIYVLVGYEDITEEETYLADVNQSGEMDILDVVLVVSWLLEEVPRTDFGEVDVQWSGSRLIITVDSGFAAVQIPSTEEIRLVSVPKGWTGYSGPNGCIALTLDGTRIQGEIVLETADAASVTEVILAGWNGALERVDLTGFIPDEYSVTTPYPNPFNSSTLLTYQIPKDQKVSIRLFNELGQSVAVLQNSYQSAGLHKMQINLEGYPSGVYFIRLTAGSFSDTQKLILLK